MSVVVGVCDFFKKYSPSFWNQTAVFPHPSDISIPTQYKHSIWVLFHFFSLVPANDVMKLVVYTITKQTLVKNSQIAEPLRQYSFGNILPENRVKTNFSSYNFSSL